MSLTTWLLGALCLCVAGLSFLLLAVAGQLVEVRDRLAELERREVRDVRYRI